MPLAPSRTLAQTRSVEPRLAALLRATARRERLESLFANPVYLDKVLTDGRYLRLCSAIAWASEREEQARQAVAMDRMIEQLRGAVAGASHGSR